MLTSLTLILSLTILGWIAIGHITKVKIEEIRLESKKNSDIEFTKQLGILKTIAETKNK